MAADSSAGQLLIFGDSWACSQGDDRTWPELLADRLGWTSLNAAEPSSNSRSLLSQALWLQWMGESVSADAWAIVHTGGNDLYFAPERQFGSFLGVGTARAACSCLCRGVDAAARGCRCSARWQITSVPSWT